jgi:protein-tyrosine-phosphatase
MVVAPLTLQVLAERNIRADGQFPKSLDMVSGEPFDVVVNLSGFRFPSAAAGLIEWPVQDPIGQNEEVYRDVANQIENLVLGLILELRADQPAA